VHDVCDFKETEVHTAEPLIPVPSRLEVEIAIVKLKKYKLPGSDQIQAGGETLLSTIHKLINSIWNNCLISGRSLVLYHLTKKGGQN
jgi:hypothetical protein